MKRLLTLFLVLWCSTAWAVEPINLVRGFNPYVAGAGVAGGCNVATEYVGTKDISGSYRTVGKDVVYCYVTTASCSGALNTAYIRNTYAAEYTAKVCLYVYDGDAPDAGDTKIGCSSAISGSTANQWDSAAMDGGTVVSGTSYFICVAVDNDSANTVDIDVSGTDITLYYRSLSGFYDTPPANLGGIPNNITDKQLSIYISIGE